MIPLATEGHFQSTHMDHQIGTYLNQVNGGSNWQGNHITSHPHGFTLHPGIFDTQVAHAQLELLAGSPAYQASATELLMRLDVIRRSPREKNLFSIVIVILEVLFSLFSGLLSLC